MKKSKRKRNNVQGTNSPKQENTDSTCNALDAVMPHTADERITQDLLQRSYLCGTEDSPRNYDSKDSFHSKNLKSSDAQTDDIYNTEADTKEAILNSVETQTSMIEVIHDISNDSSEHIYADHEIRTVTNPDNTNQDSSKDIQIPIETNTDELQNQLELQLDIQTFEFDSASQTTHKLPDETGSSLNTEKPVLKDVDRDSDKSENFCDRRSDISDTSNQTSIRSRSPKPVGALDQQETEHGVFKDIKFRSASPSAIPEKKLSKDQSSPRPRQTKADTQRLTSYDNSTLTNVTSVWDSVSSLRGRTLHTVNPYLPENHTPYLCKQCRSRSDMIRIYTVMQFVI